MKKSLNLLGTMSLLMMLVIAACILPGCGSGNDKDDQDKKTSEKTEAKLDTVKCGVRSSLDLLPIYVAMENGYFKDHGIDMQTVNISGSANTIKAMSAGEVDCGLMAFETITLSKQKGIDIWMVASYSYKPEGSTHKAFAVRADSPYYSLKDLKGKTIGGYTKNICPWFHTMWALDNAGLHEGDYNYIELRGPEMATMLVEGAIDAAAYLSDPYLTMIRDDVRVIHYWNNENAPCGCGIAFMGKKIREEPDVIERWTTAIQEGVQFIHQHEKEARLMLANYLKIDQELAMKCGLPGWDDECRLFEDMALKQFDMLLKYGVVDKIPDLDTIYDYSFTGKAHVYDIIGKQ